MDLPAIELSALAQPAAALVDPTASRRPNPSADTSSSRETFPGNLAYARVGRCDEPFGMIA